MLPNKTDTENNAAKTKDQLRKLKFYLLVFVCSIPQRGILLVREFLVSSSQNNKMYIITLRSLYKLDRFYCGF